MSADMDDFDLSTKFEFGHYLFLCMIFVFHIEMCIFLSVTVD